MSYKKARILILSLVLFSISGYQVSNINNVLADSLQPITAPISGPIVVTPTATPNATPVVTPIPTQIPQQTNNSGSSNSNSNSGSSGSQGPSAPSCNDAKPKTAPALVLALHTGPTQVSLKWIKAVDAVTNYSISYGLSSLANQYGTSALGGNNTTSFVIKGLNKGTTYYFKVRALNGCVASDYSNIALVKASGAGYVAPAVVLTPNALGSSKNIKTTPIKVTNAVSTAGPTRVLNSSKGLFSSLFTSLSGIFK